MVRWPSASERVSVPGWRGALQRGKYHWRMLVSWPLRRHFMDQVAQHPAWRELHRRHPACYYPTLRHFLDRRFGLRRRFEVALADLAAADRHFGPPLALRLVQGERVALWSLPSGCQVMLGLNDMSWHEGRWTLSLRDGAGARIYNLSFGFLPCGALLVGSVQGPRAGTPEAEERIRDLTKEAEGLRPPCLLFEALRAAAAAWRVPALLGIDPVHHVKGRRRSDGPVLRFDYRRFWSEAGARQRADDYWQAPLQAAPRDLSEVPSRKRAMYRRRQALLDGLAAALQSALRHAPAAGHPPATAPA